MIEALFDPAGIVNKPLFGEIVKFWPNIAVPPLVVNGTVISCVDGDQS